MGTLLRPDPDRRGTSDEPAAAAEHEPAKREAFVFVERPRSEPEIYVSRPELGRDPAHAPADTGIHEPAAPAAPGPDPAGRQPFVFVERPRVEPKIHISRPELGRDPAS